MIDDSASPTEVRLDVLLTALTPLCSGAAGSNGGLADTVLQRDGWNRPIIPGSQLKGRVRHMCERIAASMGIPICAAPVGATMCPSGPATVTRVSREWLDQQRVYGPARQCPICAIFGSPAYPSPLQFGDLAVTADDLPSPPTRPYRQAERLRPGVGIDRRRRTAQEAVLYLTETTERGISLRGTICGRWLSTPPLELEPLLGLLVAGLTLSERWGGGSSRGLGWGQVQVANMVLGTAVTPAALIEKVKELCRSES